MIRAKKAELIANAGFAVILAVMIIGIVLWHWPHPVPDRVFLGVIGALSAVSIVVVFFPGRWKASWFWFAIFINAFVSVAVAWLTFSILFAGKRFGLDVWSDLILIGYVAVASLCNLLIQSAFRRMFKKEAVASRSRKSLSNS